VAQPPRRRRRRRRLFQRLDAGVLGNDHDRVDGEQRFEGPEGRVRGEEHLLGEARRVAEEHLRLAGPIALRKDRNVHRVALSNITTVFLRAIPRRAKRPQLTLRHLVVSHC
jgi:hypothetical protein